ncbi:MAG TPA: aminoglycoside phosphotransferase family protein [Intrasporangium sp.]|nr:aminoglycoside phosphotransferase family protein [Intrasporangium sp.]
MTAAEPRMLSVADGPLVATTFGLDAGGRLTGPVARGQLGQVWRLDADGTSWAVKEWFASPDAAAVEAHAQFAEAALAAGVFTPRSRLSVRGTVLAEVAGTAVRVLEWVDLSPRTRRLDPSEVGRTVARLHLAGTPTSERIINWFSTGMGAQAWRDTHRRLVAAGAPFAAALEALLPDLIAVESVIEPHERPQVCHRDLWCDNVLASADGRVCVIDFENVGPADPSQELAMVLFEFGDDDPQRARRLHAAYVEAGGSGRVSRRGHFSMLVAQQAHIASYACARWIGESDPAERDRLEAWFRETPEDPVTLERIDRILAAIE